MVSSAPSIHPACHSSPSRAVWIQMSLMQWMVHWVSFKAERKVVEAKSILLKDKRVTKPFSLNTSVHVSRETTTTFDVHLAAFAAEFSACISVRDTELHLLLKKGRWANQGEAGVALKSHPRPCCEWALGLLGSCFSLHIRLLHTTCVISVPQALKDPCIFFLIMLCL